MAQFSFPRGRRQDCDETPAKSFEDHLAEKTKLLVHKAFIDVIQGRADDALAGAERTIHVFEEVAEQASVSPYLGYAHVVAGLAKNFTGDRDAAVRLLDLASSELSEPFEDRGYFYAVVGIVELADLLDRPLLAIEHLSRLVNQLEQLPQPYPNNLDVPIIVHISFRRALMIGARFEEAGMKEEEMAARQPIAALLVLAARLGVLQHPPDPPDRSREQDS